MTARRIRIGIDTGGTFTDVVAVDEDTGELAVTKTPSTPADPAVGFMAGVHKVLAELGLPGEAVSAVSHGTTVATNKLLEGKVENLGFITTEGYEFMLEIARQSVPDGYGNSYFWVKPDRIVPVHRVRTVGGRLAVDGSEIRPFDEDGAVAAARFFRDQGVNTIGVCFLHSYVDDSHERAMRRVLEREHPDAVVSISSEVLREYREYERSVTTLVDAAVKPNIRQYVANIASRLTELSGHSAADLLGGAATARPGGPTAAEPSGASRLPPDPSTAAAAPPSRSSAASPSTAASGPPNRSSAATPARPGVRPATNGQCEAAAAPMDGPGGRRREAPPDGLGAAAASGGPGGAATARPGDPTAGGRVPFYVMKSNGGVLSAEEVVHQPITTVLSGPAAGALGAAVVAQRAGFPQVVTCDGGGTSTDVSVVIDGQPALTTEGTIGAYPSKIPMIDVVTVGAGGGSIAWISPEGTLKVGPQSAGADPGPLCYGKGGTEPTITDAHVLLGRIPPHLLGGEVPLEVGLAAEGIDTLAGTLRLTRERCAAGILEISAWNQANALRQVTVKRGLDVRDFTIVTFGGSGSLLACRLVDILGLDGVLVPLNPGNLSAYGLLTVDVRNDYVQTAVARMSALDVSAVQKVYDELAGNADTALDREGFEASERVFLRTADLRYFGQAYEVRVDVPAGPVTDDLVTSVADLFHDAHRGLYGYDFRGDPRQEVEWVNLRVTGVGPIRKPSPSRAAAGTGAEAARTGDRRVFFDDWVDAGVYDRSRLGAGDVVAGPAVLEEFSSTVPVHPGFTARVDDYGNLLIRRSGGEEAR